MGTKKYPTENAYDAFLSSHGGSNNAYTELQHTVYHFEIPQEHLNESLDRFAQFFLHPLLLPNAVERELQAIESEFQLSKMMDDCRLQQLWCHTCKQDATQHPFCKFSWGNTHSLQTVPQSNNIDMIAELRKFYNAHYYASNMRLVVIGAYSLDELEQQVLSQFATISPSPTPQGLTSTKPRSLPLAPSSLGRIYRMVPVHDRHTLSITWQLPCQKDNWKTKPCDYLAHLLGHESAGSLLSLLKKKSWAVGCSAGVGGGGHEDASSHALFTLGFVLSEEGGNYWTEIIQHVYTYIGMIRHYFQQPDGMPPWLYKELEAIQNLSYKFADELSPADFVEDIVENLSPTSTLPHDRLLDGNGLIFEYDSVAILDIVENYLTPENSRVDFLSSTFGRSSDYEGPSDNTSSFSQVEPFDNDGDAISFVTQNPQTEPMFGTTFWCHVIPFKIMDQWRMASQPSLPNTLSLPPVNPFLPTCFELKNLPVEDVVELGTVEDHLEETTLLKLEDDSTFPPIPPASSEARLPNLIVDSQILKLWHLQDRKFKRPIADLRLKFVTTNANISPLHRACADLYVMLCQDSSTETTYQASVCELEFVGSANDAGFHLRAYGFDHKLLCLAEKMISIYLSFRLPSEANTGVNLPNTIKPGRFQACLESLRRNYGNFGLKASGLCTNTRLRCLRPTIWSAHSKLKALNDLATNTFMTTIRSILDQMSVEVLYHGNCNQNDARTAATMIGNALKTSGVKTAPKDSIPKELVLKIRAAENNDRNNDLSQQPVTLSGLDPNESNTAVELYFQIGVDNIEERVMIDVLCQIMYEPLFDQLRTKEQFGYHVSVGPRWTYGVLGMSFEVVTASRSAVEATERLERFLIDFRKVLEEMPPSTFAEQVASLAKNKLQMFNSLAEESSSYWSEITAGRYDWEVYRNEALELRGIKQENAVAAYEKWLLSGTESNRRRLAMHIIGSGVAVSLDRPKNVSLDVAKAEVDKKVAAYHALCNQETWGVIY